MLDELDREIQGRGLDNDVQLTTCGCMGLCEEGPLMVVYPGGVWYRRVQHARAPLHGFARPANNMAFNAASEEFLARYLGGRFEPATTDESKLLTSVKQ